MASRTAGIDMNEEITLLSPYVQRKRLSQTDHASATTLEPQASVARQTTPCCA